MARAQARVGQAADADCDVDAVLHQIDVAVVKAKVDLQARVFGHVAQHQRCQHAAPEGHGRVDAQRAGGALLHQAGQVLGVFHLVQDGLAALVVQRAGLGGRHAAGGAVQQPRAQVALGLGHGLGGGGLGGAQRERGLAEAARLHHPHEHLHDLKAIHGASSLSGYSDWE